MNSTNWDWERQPMTLKHLDEVEDYHERMSKLYMGWWLKTQRRVHAMQEEIDKLVVELDLREGPEFCAGCTRELENPSG